ncbi:hypothetical protein SAMN06265338_11918 [Rhodoblastus acidophilus]|uniref:Stability/partitioning determinant n=1 Tax=Rhodoblastus acidophilus TaxID=1074 RepID=A0A212SA01_RHOAC|nr:stability/partitioning determinant [Rhodoblastus acidophilus]PPQ35931.1 hypothetical protein CKO16_19310 [Rhodoblastus acidophilus]RAI18269.1 hypothetical protein CH337_14620 [Rhodoblastus acidophilus]SNB82273.1 hypothetical protein SAMN06265338_11918 [Rhodoblastus acidophilus]
MMGDRAQLNFDDDDLSSPPPPSVPVEKILEVTRKAGFHETPKSAPSGEDRPRRTRLKTGRVKQFATRLHPDTVDAFHDYADAHRITVAETLERALAALLVKEKASR